MYWVGFFFKYAEDAASGGGDAAERSFDGGAGGGACDAFVRRWWLVIGPGGAWAIANIISSNKQQAFRTYYAASSIDSLLRNAMTLSR